ncbi:Glutaredoxin [Terribacillus halophilus]|uniref:Glutaredoxin n=1 Tax=Terribacillus halophilus TaxID=361279 RepID=A0A1G6RWZ5_9BACI|nr:glutaredoxin family protein [Terribacillus halophilus]SDD09109.1 Glutaredoxin [Terribacillus halophilus]
MRHREVEVYISDDCRQCEQVIDQLKKWNIHYTVKNITNSPAFLKEMQAHSIYSVPLVLINGEKVHGFQKDRIQQLLG